MCSFNILQATIFPKISHFFPKIFIEVFWDSWKIWIFTSLILTISINLDFFTFTWYKKIMMPASLRECQQFFDLKLF